MLDTRTIELALPEGTTLDQLDIDALEPEQMRTLLRTVFQKDESECDAARELLGMLERNGWTVRQGLTWVAHAERGEHSERVSAPTVCEAVARLREYTLLHDSEGCP